MIGGAKTKARAADEGGDALLDSLLGEIEQDPMNHRQQPVREARRRFVGRRDAACDAELPAIRR